MTSILTNAAAVSALQTLRSVNSSYQETQNQVSSGYRISKASDNAAYWSISVTMKSDRQAIGATQDAMAIGAAKADTAYAATDSIVDVLSQFKSRLVAATEDGVDKTKIQSELAQLNAQAESMVRSASFNGVNWLKTDSPTHIQDLSVLTDRVVSGFVRDANNNVSVQTNEVDLRRTSMLNTGGGGILQKDVLDYYMPLGGMTNNTDHHYAHEDHTFNGPVTFDVSDFVDFNLVVDRSGMAAGDTFAVSVDKSVIDSALGTTDGIIKDAKDLRAVLQKAFDNAGASTAAGIMNTYTTSTTRFEIRSLETTGNIGSSVYVEDLDSSFNASSPSKFLGLDSTPSLNHDNMFPSSSMSFIQPFKIMLDTKIDFDLSIDGSTLQTYTIDRDAVDAALGTTDGRINSADDLKTIVQYVTGNVGLAINVSGNQMVYSADQADYPGYGTNAVDFYMSSFRPDPPFTLRFDLAEVDVTDDTFSVDEYIQGVEHMLQDAIKSGSTIGSVQTRIDLQSEFAARLGDSIDSGVGRLVDADMEEASTRLSALQTQQQIAVQSLQIANSNPNNIMTLFQ